MLRRISTGSPQETGQNSPVETAMKSEPYDPKVDCAWTNRLVGLACEVVNYCFGSQQQSIEKWMSLTTRVESWNIQKPLTFEPFFEQSSDISDGHPFPTVHLLNDWHGKLAMVAG